MLRIPTSPARLSPRFSLSLALFLSAISTTGAVAQTAKPAPAKAAVAPPKAAALPSMVVAPPTQPAAGGDVTVSGTAGKEIEVLPGGPVFISPMGEPFRSKDKLSGAEHWFAQADTDHDDELSLEEFKADAFRFFASLDTDKSDDIGPIELEHYEEFLAPEVKVTNSWGDPSKGKVDSDGNYQPPPYPERMGAGRLSYLAIPEPVIYADTNFDRGVDRREFNAAAEKRFKLLDRNGDGRIKRSELPKPGG